MMTKRYIDVKTAVAAALVLGVAACWAQQKSNLPVANAAASAAAIQQLAMAQQSSISTGPASASSSSGQRQTGSNPASSVGLQDDPLFSLADAVRTKRNDDRQKRLEADTQRLLNLANQLKSEVTAAGAESMTPEMLRQTDEIEKLAKSVKDRMRN